MTKPGGELALLVLGSVLAAGSALCSLAGLLELLVILGPVACCTTWWLHNAVLLVAWLPVLALAGYELHTGWQTAVPFVVLGAFFTFSHMCLLFAYWLRRSLRRQAAMELPTQQLLTEAHRMMLAGAVETTTPWGVPFIAPAANSSAAANGNGATNAPMVSAPATQFQLQVGRTDGVAGYTLYIPAEAEEVAIMEAAARLQHQRQQQAAAAALSNSPPQHHHDSLLDKPGARGSLDRHPAFAGPTGGSVPPSPSMRSVPSGRNGSGAVPFGTPSGRHSRQSSAGGAPGLLQQPMSGPGAGQLPPGASAAPRSVIRVLAPENLPRWGSSGNRHRFRAFADGFTGSPAGSLKRNAAHAQDNEQHTTTGYVPPSVAADERQQRNQAVSMGGAGPDLATTSMATAAASGLKRSMTGGLGVQAGTSVGPTQQHPNGSSPQGGTSTQPGAVSSLKHEQGVLESSNPLLHEYSLQHMSAAASPGSRMSPEHAARPLVTHSRSSSADVHLGGTLHTSARSVLGGHGLQQPSSPLGFGASNRKEHGSTTDNITVIDQYSVGAERSATLDAAISEAAVHAAVQAANVHHDRASSMRALIDGGGSSSGAVFRDTPRSPALQQPGAPPPATPSLASIPDKPSAGGNAGVSEGAVGSRKAVDKKLAKTSHRPKHSRTHSWAHSSPFGLPLLEQTDSSAEVPQEAS